MENLNKNGKKNTHLTRIVLFQHTDADHHATVKDWYSILMDYFFYSLFSEVS